MKSLVSQARLSGRCVLITSLTPSRLFDDKSANIGTSIGINYTVRQPKIQQDFIELYRFLAFHEVGWPLAVG
jgi:hypothetical protein